MYSLPMSVTLAALTIASAASTDPMRPLVSIESQRFLRHDASGVRTVTQRYRPADT